MNERELLFMKIDRTTFYTMEIDDKFHLVLSHIHKCMRCKFITGLYYKSITMNEIIADDISIKLPSASLTNRLGRYFLRRLFHGLNYR